ncbi:nucleolin-like [Frankliniella occidentalis]|uniref:Nucleolin-like n=1 Tax=Frankliniella occidentalis TaxID=133901 RepID=A0A9C6XWG0_FRAOC|nr:nucleolin-like [Frankliniella occidentalis]
MRKTTRRKDKRSQVPAKLNPTTAATCRVDSGLTTSQEAKQNNDDDDEKDDFLDGDDDDDDNTTSDVADKGASMEKEESKEKDKIKGKNRESAKGGKEADDSSQEEGKKRSKNVSEESEDAADNVPKDDDNDEDEDDDDDDEAVQPDGSSSNEALANAEKLPFRTAEEEVAGKGESEAEFEKISKPIEVEIVGADSKQAALNVTAAERLSDSDQLDTTAAPIASVSVKRPKKSPDGELHMIAVNVTSNQKRTRVGKRGAGPGPTVCIATAYDDSASAADHKGTPAAASSPYATADYH